MSLVLLTQAQSFQGALLNCGGMPTFQGLAVFAPSPWCIGAALLAVSSATHHGLEAGMHLVDLALGGCLASMFMPHL